MDGGRGNKKGNNGSKLKARTDLAMSAKKKVVVLAGHKHILGLHEPLGLVLSFWKVALKVNWVSILPGSSPSFLPLCCQSAFSSADRILPRGC